MRMILQLKRTFLMSVFAFMLAFSTSGATEKLPIVFVHGNGDYATLWTTTIWRFESNGYDANLLSAVNLIHPNAPGDDTKPAENQSTTVDQASQLASFVARTLLTTGKDKVILVGSSRGGNTIRNYIKFAGGHATVALAVLCGTPNHGVFAAPAVFNSEWNGMGHFLARLNATSEVHPDVPFVTTRSDKNDKYAQPTGEFIGQPGKPTGVDYKGPELRGALNIVLPGLDHREVAFHKNAFKEIYRVITGRAPAKLDIVAEDKAELNGMIIGYDNGWYTNLPLVGAKVEVYAVDSKSGQRQGNAVRTVSTGADGTWGPLKADPKVYYEFVVKAEGYPTSRFYLTPFPRSSKYIHFRIDPLKDEQKKAGAVVVLSRPRGYIGHGRDTFLIDGKVPEGVNKGVAGTASATKIYPQGTSKVVKVVLNKEAVSIKLSSTEKGHKIVALFHY
ncbi:MAG: alpha/beta fold hydrolase [Deltaproteobacteria bacterium]|jgi:triacylglycerol lipase|nr:alpha/beta fold hydrolase [Deltaproteobacteria bacterium]MBT7155256.1 alpha/beta fold hydrolase [Deltaproteobacteria bacterium]